MDTLYKGKIKFDKKFWDPKLGFSPETELSKLELFNHLC